MLAMLKITAVDHIVFNVRDIEVSANWYVRILGMARLETRSDAGEDRTSVAFGHNKINLRPIDATQDSWFTGKQPCVGSQDICFLTDMPSERVAAHLSENAVKIELGPVVKQGARGPINSVYVRDPDGNLIEISSYDE